jgi:4-alpha-glucanotransferase
MKKLPALRDASNMLICGEDLGMIPDSVPRVLKRLGLLSLEVQRMPKQLGQIFSNPQQYPYLSVCTTSTHDLSTLRGLWLEDEHARNALWHEVLHRTDEPPIDCAPELCRQFLRQNLAATSMWCILPLQDWLGADADLRHPDPAAERINVPANPRHYWRYRMHLTLETLLGATGFNQTVAQLIANAGRSQPQ